MNISDKVRTELTDVYRESLSKLFNKEYTDNELDNTLKLLFSFLVELKQLTDEEVKESVQYLDNREILKKKAVLKKKYEKTKKNKYSKKLKERLYRHFNTDIGESIETKEDKSLEVKLKHKVQGEKIYVEHKKVLLTMMNSMVCTQYEVDKIKLYLEEDYTFTSSIKHTIKDRNKLSKIKRLCLLQDERFERDEETTKRLY